MTAGDVMTAATMTNGGTGSRPTVAGPDDDEWARILGFILGNSGAWIVDIGLRSGLLILISKAGPAGISAEDLADVAGLDPVLTATWCQAAFAYRILDWDRSSYSLPAPLVAILLDPSSPRYLGGRVQFYAALYEDFRAYPDLLRSRSRLPRSEHDPWLLAALANLTRPDAVMITDHVIPQTSAAEALAAGGSVLDIGSGTGQHLVHYARTFRQARIEGLEPDAVSIEMARATVAAAGVADRVRLRAEDANNLEDSDRHTVVILNVALHETGGPHEWRNVLRRVRAALRPGGTVIVSELPYPDDVADYRTNPVYQMLAGVQLHEVVAGCGSITRDQLRELLVDAQFADVRVATQPMPTRHVVVGSR